MQIYGLSPFRRATDWSPFRGSSSRTGCEEALRLPFQCCSCGMGAQAVLRRSAARDYSGRRFRAGGDVLVNLWGRAEVGAEGAPPQPSRQ